MTGRGPGTVEPVQPDSRRGFSATEVVLGMILLAVGIIWFLRSTDIVNMSWYVVFAAALVVIGLALVIGSVAGEQSGLISIGVILTAVLMLGSWMDLNFGGGVGDRTFAPASIEQVETSYETIAGTLRLDLSAIDFPEGETVIEAQVMAGRIQVIIPDDVALRVDWNVLAGDVEVLGQQRAGVVLDDSDASPGFDDASQRLILNLRVLAGQIEVYQ